jgi:protein-tyrosine phosphatase
VPRALARFVLRAHVRHDALAEWRRRLAGEPALPPKIDRVLVLCHGNVCRSPFAAALLARRLPQLEVRSAGLAARGGDAADALAARVARRFGVELDAHRTSALDEASAGWADLLLAMQGRHASELERRFRGSGPRVRLLGDFLESPPHAIEHPWGRDEAAFEAVFERIERAVERLASRIEAASGSADARGSHSTPPEPAP